MGDDEKGEETEGTIEMKELTSTPFGLIVAYFLPGVGGLCTLAYFSHDLRDMLERSLTASSNFGLVIVLACAALAVGMQVNAVRWVVFQKFLCRKAQLDPTDFKKLGSAVKVVDFRAAVDEYYRYHQFYGGIAIVALVFYPTWLVRGWSSLSTCDVADSLLVFAVMEAVTICFGLYTYSTYIKLGKQILGG